MSCSFFFLVSELYTVRIQEKVYGSSITFIICRAVKSRRTCLIKRKDENLKSCLAFKQANTWSLFGFLLKI